MKKNEMIKAVATKAELSQKDVTAVIDALGATIEDVVKAGDTVTVLGAKFGSKDVPERTGTIQLGDKKGEQWCKPAHKEAYVKATKALKTIVE